MSVVQKQKSTHKGTAAAAAALAGISFGVGGTMNQITAGWGLDISLITLAQFVCASVILGVVVLARFRCHLSKCELWQLCLLGVCDVISLLSYFYAIDFLSVAQAVAIQFQYVWIAVVLQHMIDRKKPTVWMVLIVVAIVIGTLLGSGLVDDIIGSGSFSLDPLGVVLALVCALSYGIFIAVNDRIAPEVPSATRTCVITVSGLPVIAVFAFFTVGSLANLPLLLPAGIIMALTMSVVPIVGLGVAATGLPGGIVAILSSLELPTAVLSGALLLGEEVTPLTVVGVLLILASVVFQELIDMGKIGRRRTLGD
ncbi:MAG: EamA family transporter [Coriobacteriales bacterium]|jgi:inner membrane transporter RhtA|nr:EamA family transporter [Coriobacteriales bacterium]